MNKKKYTLNTAFVAIPETFSRKLLLLLNDTSRLKIMLFTAAMPLSLFGILPNVIINNYFELYDKQYILLLILTL